MPEPIRDDRELEVRREEIRAGVQRVADINKTVRFCFGVLGLVATVGIVSYAAVKVTSEPEASWFTLAIAIFGPSGLVATLGGAYIGRLRGRVTSLQKQIDKPAEPPQIGEAK